jgi:hypothetical protein
VKAETNRAIRELESGVAKFKDSAAKYDAIREFDELATKSGTTVKAALENYVGFDMALRDRDPEKRLNAIESILEVAGVTPRQYAEYIIQSVNASQQQDNSEASQLRRELAQLKEQLGSVTGSIQAQQQAAQQSEQEAFFTNWAADKPDIAEHAQEVAKYYLEGLSLDDALNKARIEAREKAIRLGFKPNAAPQTPAQTRVSKSITGPPSNGSDPSRRTGAVPSIREALSRAIAQAG